MRVYLIIGFILLSQFSCNAQTGTLNASSFVKSLEKEIDKSPNNGLFNDTVTFLVANKSRRFYTIKEIRSNWDKVKALYKGTDYTLNKEKSNSTTVEGNYVLMSHRYKYIIGVNNKGKIVLVKEVKSKLPPDAPPIPAGQ